MAITSNYPSVKATRKRRLALKQELLALRGCEKCGEEDPIVLSLHHPDPSQKHPVLRRNRRRNNWADLSFDLIREEIEKGVVLCANCHLREEARLRLDAVEEVL